MDSVEHAFNNSVKGEMHGCHDYETPENCAQWVKENECKENPKWMLKRCAASCGLCSHVCSDHEPEGRCKDWAKDGQCEVNKAYMGLNCPASCGVCQKLDGNVLPGHDEL